MTIDPSMHLIGALIPDLKQRVHARLWNRCGSGSRARTVGLQARRGRRQTCEALGQPSAFFTVCCLRLPVAHQSNVVVTYVRPDESPSWFDNPPAGRDLPRK